MESEASETGIAYPSEAPGLPYRVKVHMFHLICQFQRFHFVFGIVVCDGLVCLFLFNNNVQYDFFFCSGKIFLKHLLNIITL